MAQLIVIIFCIIAVITSFFSITGGWLIMAVPTTFFLINALALKQKKWQPIHELSEPANLLLVEYGHYYSMPFAGRDFSASSSTLGLVGAGITVINVFKGFYWGIGIGISYWCVMIYLARFFNPTNFLVDPIEKASHQELINFILEKQKSGVDSTQPKVPAEAAEPRR